MRSFKLFLIICFLAPLPLLSGDAAIFASLGLSPESRYFAFAQYGEQDGSGFPYAEIYIVDVKRNSFVPGGVAKRLCKQDAEPLPGGLAILLELRAETDSLFKAYNIQAVLQPKIVVPVADSERVHAAWKHDDDTAVMVTLEQKNRGEAGAYSSSAAFQLELVKDGAPPLHIGTIKRFRKHVIRYDIDRILAAKNNGGAIFVIRMTKVGFEGPDIRYMVETCFNKKSGEKE